MTDAEADSRTWKQAAPKLIEGAFDLHTHAAPETTTGLDGILDDVQAAKLAQELGMSGFVLKSHFWPTMSRVYNLSHVVPGFHAISSITLNTLVGGLSPAVVDMALLQGARAVWFPTWSAESAMAKKPLSARLGPIFAEAEGLVPEVGISVLQGGALIEEAAEILRIAKNADVMVGTGHISPQEVLALAAEAQRIGFDKLVFTHPWSHVVGASDTEIAQAAALGVWIELSFSGMLPARQTLGPGDLKRVMNLVGPERCILTTDGGFQDWASPAPMILWLCITSLLASGVPEAAVRTMLIENPRYLIPID